MTGFFQRNLGLKATALGLAFFVWFLVSSEERAFARQMAPVVYNLGSDADIALIDEPPAEVEVQVECPRSTVGRALEGLAVLVDLEDATVGSRTVSLDEDSLQSLPTGCTAQVSPDRLTLTLDAKIERQVPFVETVSGDPLDGYEVGQISPRPPSVWVTGPQSAFEGHDVKVLSDPVDLTPLDADGTSEVHILRTGGSPNTAGIRLLSDTEFRVIVEVLEIRGRVEREIPVLGTGASVEADPPTVTVVVEGYPSRADVFFDGLQALVDTEGLSAEWSPHDVTLSRDITEFAGELVSVTPARVRIRAVPQEGGA